MFALVLFMCSAATFNVQAPALDEPCLGPPARFEITDQGSDSVARVVDPETGEEIPSKVQQQRDKRYVYWSRTDDGSTSRTYRIETGVASAFRPVFVGAGGMLDYGKRGIVADLGVGLWATAMPIDWDHDGDWDLLYSCQDKPQSGVYLYIHEENNVFRRAKRFRDGEWYCALGDVNGDGLEDLLAGTNWYENVRGDEWKKHENIIPRPEEKYRSFMTRQVDWDGDGLLDLVSAAGDWRGYGWDRGFDEKGNWTREPLHGPLWFHKNTGSNTEPVYAEREQLKADDKPIDIFGSPCPSVADFDNDGDLDIICGEFRDGFTYFENFGSRTNPKLAAGRPVMSRKGPLRIDLCMMSAATCDWNGDGRFDLLVGHEDGRVSVMLNLGVVQEAPVFAEEFFLKEIEPEIKSGGLVTPWLDVTTGNLYCGNTAGYIELFRMRDGGYVAGKYLREGRESFRIMAGYNLSIQGPAEKKWGYTVPFVADLDGDEKLDIVLNSIVGKIECLAVSNIGQAERIPLNVEWPADPPKPEWNWWDPGKKDLVVQWRTRPNILDWDKDGKNDIIAIDHEGYLALYRNLGESFKPGERIFLDEKGEALKLTAGPGGKSGRTKPHVVDWDGDGDYDILRNTENTGWFENVGENKFAWRGEFPIRQLAGHTTAPQAVDWNADGKLDLIVGAEDGRIYCYLRTALEEPDKLDAQR